MPQKYLPSSMYPSLRGTDVVFGRFPYQELNVASDSMLTFSSTAFRFEIKGSQQLSLFVRVGVFVRDWCICCESQKFFEPSSLPPSERIVPPISFFSSKGMVSTLSSKAYQAEALLNHPPPRTHTAYLSTAPRSTCLAAPTENQQRACWL